MLLTMLPFFSTNVCTLINTVQYAHCLKITQKFISSHHSFILKNYQFELSECPNGTFLVIFKHCDRSFLDDEDNIPGSFSTHMINGGYVCRM